MQACKILAKLTGSGSAGLVVRDGISDFENSGSVFTYRRSQARESFGVAGPR